MNYLNEHSIENALNVEVRGNANDDAKEYLMSYLENKQIWGLTITAQTLHFFSKEPTSLRDYEKISELFPNVEFEYSCVDRIDLQWSCRVVFFRGEQIEFEDLNPNYEECNVSIGDDLPF